MKLLNLLKRFLPVKPYTVETGISNIKAEQAKLRGFAEQKGGHIEEHYRTVDRLQERINALGAEKRHAETVASKISI